MRDLTVFVMADGKLPLTVRAMVESWTRAGITQDSLWVSAGKVNRGAGGPPIVKAVAVSGGGSRDVDLFGEIGRFKVDVLRVVAVHLVLQDGGTDPALDSAASAVADAIEATLPHHSSASGTGSHLHKTLLVIPVSGVTQIDRAVLKRDWAVNAVIAPEDRPDVDRASVYVRHPGNYVGHAAAAMSAVGGILRGVSAGVLDDRDVDVRTGDADVVVARVSIRSVTGEEAVDAVADHLLDPSDFRPTLPQDVLPWARPAATPALLSSSAARHILKGSAWAPTPFTGSASFSNQNQGAWAAIKTAAVFNLKTTGAVLSWGMTTGRARIERDLTGAIVGAGSGVLITLGPQPVDDLEIATSRFVREERGRIETAIKMESRRASPPPATTWSELRTLCFGLVDGGDLGTFDEPTNANRRELLPAPYIVPAPGESYERHDTEVPLEAADARGMKNYRNQLIADRTAAANALTAATEALEAERARIEQKQPRTGDQGHLGAEPKLSAAEMKKLTALEEAKDAATDKDAVARTRATAYESWFNTVSSSILWQVADDVITRVSSGRARQKEIESAAKSKVPSADGLKGSRKALNGWWIGTSIAWLIGVVTVLGVVTEWRVPPSWERFWDQVQTGGWWLIGITVVVAVVLILANHAFYLAMREYEARVERYLAQVRNASEEQLHVGREVSRYEFLLSGLRVWTDIFSELLHQPWAHTDAKYEDLPDEVIDDLPASMGVARQSKDAFTTSTALLIQSYALLYKKGWTSSYFNAVLDRWESEHGAESHEGYRSVDLDTALGDLSPRNRFRRYWEENDARRYYTQRARGEFIRAARDGSLEVPNRVVQRLGKYGDAVSVPEPEFYRATATESTTFATEIFSAAGRQGRRHYVERSIAWLPATARAQHAGDTVELRACAGPTAVRVDVTRRMVTNELSIFSSAVRTSTSPVDLPVPSPSKRIVEIDSELEDSVWH